MSVNIGLRYLNLFISFYMRNSNLQASTNNISKRTIQSLCKLSNKIIVSTDHHQKHVIISPKSDPREVLTNTDLVVKLRNLLKITQNEIKEILRKQKEIRKYSPQVLEDNFNVCLNNGIRKKTLQKYPTILLLDNVPLRIEYLKSVSTDINLLAPILIADKFMIKKIVTDLKSEENDVPYGNRIVYISKLLNLPETEVCEKVIDHLFVLRMPIDRLESTLKVLLEYGIEPKNIINDCWALRYNPKVAEERLKKALDANVLKVKTWMIRCPNSVFERCINRQVENRKILGSNATVEEYLSQRLECSIENAKFLTEKNPALLKMNVLKMKEILDYLYDQGYTSAQVCRVPRILIHSLETTKQRIQQLKNIDFVPLSIAILCKSKRDFDKAIKKFKKMKKVADERQAKSERI